MNLGEWLEKRKTEGNLYSKSEFLPLRKCSYCGEVMYNRVRREPNTIYSIIRDKTVCVACKEERERAKQRDPYFEFDVNDKSFISINPVHHKVVHEGDKYDFSKTVYINKEGGVKPVFRDWQKEETELIKQGRVQEVLELMEMHFNELRGLL